MLVSSLSYRQLTSDTGVYLFLDKKGKVIYCGKAINLRKRVSSYFLDKNLGEKTRKLVDQIYKIRTIPVDSEVEAFLLEERLIKKYSPRYNIALKDDKSYPLLKITVKEKYPSVLITRKKDDEKSIYFGPYTSVNSLKIVLKLLRRIFPYQSVLRHSNKICLYFHLGLCPCPSVFDDKNYGKNIKHIIEFMNGNTKKLIKDLELERNNYSKVENFENASEVQKRIDSIKLITSPFYKPFLYDENPNLRSDILRQQLIELSNILNSHGIIVKKINRIECYDISNTSGTNSTASMVVFINGQKKPDLYRRFKIKGFYKNKSNDFAMIKEVLSRRLKHSEWEMPDLIVIDGGKGQVSSAIKVLSEFSLNTPLIGLAKREEIIITPNQSQIILLRDSKPLQLIMRIRDEAHRFAITYHKKLRSKFIYA